MPLHGASAGKRSRAVCKVTAKGSLAGMCASMVDQVAMLRKCSRAAIEIALEGSVASVSAFVSSEIATLRECRITALKGALERPLSGVSAQVVLEDIMHGKRRRAPREGATEDFRSVLG